MPLPSGPAAFGRKVTLKLRYGNFETITRQGAAACSCLPDDAHLHKALDPRKVTSGRGIRLVGVGTGNLVDNRGSQQLSFFDTPGRHREEKIAETVDKLTARYGKGTVKRASLLRKGRPGKE